MKIGIRKARLIGLTAIAAVVVIQLLSSIFCYQNDLSQLAFSFMMIAVPFSPALIWILSPNPLLTVGGAALFIPWLVLAFTVDCILPYAGGGASMMYVAVVIWGFPSTILGMILAKLAMKYFNISVVEEGNTEGSPKTKMNNYQWAFCSLTAPPLLGFLSLFIAYILRETIPDLLQHMPILATLVMVISGIYLLNKLEFGSQSMKFRVLIPMALLIAGICYALFLKPGISI